MCRAAGFGSLFVGTQSCNNRLVLNYALMITNKRTALDGAEGNKSKENESYSSQPRLWPIVCDRHSVIQN